MASGDASTTALFYSKAVRDLAWTFSSPDLLSADAGVPVCSPSWCRRAYERSLPWLLALDADPTPLEDWLQRQHNVRRLGFYHAALLEFWVRFSPAVGSDVCGVGGRTLLRNVQVHAGRDGEVAGQLKMVFARRAEAGHAEVVHWESHVKYFAFCPDDEPNDDASLEERLAEYVGPFLGKPRSARSAPRPVPLVLGAPLTSCTVRVLQARTSPAASWSSGAR